MNRVPSESLRVRSRRPLWASIIWREKLQVNAGVRNFLNSDQKDFVKGPDRDKGFIYGPSAPRSLFVGLKLGW